jgi:Suppressor of fused protein (SUFU)
MTQIDYPSAIQDHYVSSWSSPVDAIRWIKGPVSDLSEDFRVLVIPRPPEMMAYATRCMSQPTDKERLELHLLTRSSQQYQPDLVEVLTAVAHYHRTGRSLGLGHSVNFGKPWLTGSMCTHGLISLPYLDGPALEWLEEPAVRFLWLIPITEAEASFKKRFGMEALEQKFEEKQFDFLDPGRASVV